MRMKSLYISFFALLLLFAAGSLYAFELVPGDKEFTVKTARLEALFRNGAIVHLIDRQTGRILANKELNDDKAPVGLGILKDLDNFRAAHIPWGEPSMGQHLKPDFPLNNYWRPDKRSIYKLEKTEKNIVSASWTGLTNGKDFLTDARLSLEVASDSSGALTVRISGSNPAAALFGGQCPLLNIDNEAKIIVPSFGGMLYTKDGTPCLMPLGGSPFLEAPILIAQLEKKSIGVWMEDETFRPHYAFVKRSGKSFSLAFESLNLMPFEPHKNFISPVMKIDIFNGDWKSAATPFRAWYARLFEKEIKVRDSVEWANKITNVFDIYMTIPGSEVLKKIAAVLPHESVMFQTWNGRAPLFDTELPDWTPRKGYVEGVKRIHDNEFKTMAYVNTYCANYQSPVWKRDNLSDFFMTRKNGCWTYKGSSTNNSDSMNEKLLGTVDGSSSDKNQFADIPEKRLLYGDPLSKRWRIYHAEMMKWWNSTTGTDANYEDTAGCTGDSGNGVVDGIAAAQGSVEQMRLLLQTQPSVPMSSEYGPSGIAFGIKWALNYASHWGNDIFKDYRTNHQVPLTSYVYGYRNWMTALMCNNDKLMHTVAASSDATGGMGFMLVDYFLNRSLEDLRKTDYSFAGHLFLRAKLFAEKELKPYFPEGNYPPNIRCMYQGKDGIYQYSDDGRLQQMIGPDGTVIYGRLHGVTEVATSLYLADWPFQNGKKIYGLDPEAHYPLFPRPENIQEAALQIDNLPGNAVVKKYYEGSNFAYLEINALSATPAETEISFKFNKEFSHLIVNDSIREIKGNSLNLKTKLPTKIVVIAGAPPCAEFNAPLAKPEQIVTQIVSGRVQGKSSMLGQHERHKCNVQTLYLNNGIEAYADFLFQVPDTKDAAVELYMRNIADYVYGADDGTIVKVLINGSVIKEFDCRLDNPERKNNPKALPYVFDKDLHYWNIPLGAYAGKPILLSIVVDSRKSTARDRQFISVPVLTRNKAQVFEEKVIKPEIPAKAAEASKLEPPKENIIGENGVLNINGYFKEISGDLPTYWHQNTYASFQPLGQIKVMNTQGKNAVKLTGASKTTHLVSSCRIPVKADDKIELCVKAQGEGTGVCGFYAYNAENNSFRQIGFAYKWFKVKPEMKEYSFTLNVKDAKDYKCTDIIPVIGTEGNAVVEFESITAKLITAPAPKE